MAHVMANATGARLSYVVVAQEGKVVRHVHQWTKKGIVRKDIEEPAGFLVFFPKGHVLRMRDEAMLKRHRLNKAPRIINMEGLSDPNSALGKMMTAQDIETRQKGYQDLEQQVIGLSMAHSGKIELTRNINDLEQPEDDE